MKLLRVRQEEARQRDAARAARTPQQQLDKIVAAGHGHSREAKRLIATIAAAAQEKKKTGVLSKKTNKGFTLIEVVQGLVMLLVFAGICGIVYTVVHFLAKIW